MHPSFVDLHTHTLYSDGTDTPEELMRKASRLSLSSIAITDHDTISGLDEAEEAGLRYGVEVVRGCEVSSRSPFGDLHLLALWIPKHCPDLEDFLKMQRRLRDERNLRILEKLASFGIRIEYEEVLEQCGTPHMTPGRPHIAAVLLNRHAVSSYKDAFTQYLAEGASAYVPRPLPDFQKVIAFLSECGVLVSWAHPLLLRCPRSWIVDILPEMKRNGLKAIEAYYSEYSQADTHFCVSLAARNGLACSGGSDYHGLRKPDIALGRGKGGLRVTQAIYEQLKQHRQSLML
ncbi:MAG: PHP domain-containing protein [Desulfovibrionaceae bacterium]|nr:PHP domain-containing protein [Desulfovibrionaceae bacterium]